jgi:hypothetical protein
MDDSRVRSAAVAAMLFARVTLRTALAISIAGSGSPEVTSGLNDLAWSLSVIVSFSAAMLVMAGSFGLWRTGMISKAAFAEGWRPWCSSCSAERPGRAMASAPDGGYAIVSGIMLYGWVAVVSGFLYMRRPSTVSTRDRAAVPV